MRIIMPERTIKGKRVGIILSNHKLSPFTEKERHAAGKDKMITVSRKAKNV